MGTSRSSRSRNTVQRLLLKEFNRGSHFEFGNSTSASGGKHSVHTPQRAYKYEGVGVAGGTTAKSGDSVAIMTSGWNARPFIFKIPWLTE